MFSKSIKYGVAVLLATSSLSACSFNSNLFNFNDGGRREAELAVVSYTNGDFNTADEHIKEALYKNSKNAQALLVGALTAEKTNRPNRARDFYEEIINNNGNEVSVLGAVGSQPEKITDIAQKRLRQLNLQQNKLIVEDAQGNKVFNLSEQTAQANNKAAMKKALATRQAKAPTKSSAADVEALFTDDERNIVARFMIIKELAENDMITKEEFLRARQSNIGGLLPLSYTPASTQVIKPVPTTKIIIDRINALKAAVEDRAISSKEFSAERNLIIEAILPPNPTVRLKKKSPARDIISAAKDLRKLEVLYDLNLITSSEKDKEKQIIEQALGLNRSEPEETTTQLQILPQPETVIAPTVTTTTKPVANNVDVVTVQTTVQTSDASSPVTVQANKPTTEAQPILPAVSSPFNK